MIGVGGSLHLNLPDLLPGIGGSDMVGAMYSNTQSVRTISLANTFYGAVALSAGELTGGITFNDDNVDGDYLQIPLGGDGLFCIWMGTSFSGPVNSDIHLSVFINDTESALQWQRTTGASSSIGNAFMVMPIQLVGLDKVRVKGKSDNTGNFTFEHSQVGVFKAES
jgi:hypothetical protein